jgi:hypothetical protein
VESCGGLWGATGARPHLHHHYQHGVTYNSSLRDVKYYKRLWRRQELMGVFRRVVCVVECGREEVEDVEGDRRG